jgi:flagellar hook-length control protein FliK
LALPLSAPDAPAGSDKGIPPEGGIPPGDGQTVARPRGQDARGTEQVAIEADVRLATAGRQGQAGGEQAGAASPDAERDQAWLNGPSRADGSVPPPVQQGGESATPKLGKDAARPSDAIAQAVATRSTTDADSDRGGASLTAQDDGGQDAGRQAGEQRLSEQVHQASAGSLREGKDSGKEGRGQEAAQSFAGIERQIAGLGPNSNQEAKSTPPVPPAHPVVPPADETASPPASRSVSLEVQPPELGRVQLRVTVAEQTVHAHVTTEQVEVKNFLVANQARLETGLQAHGMDIGSFQVDVDAHGRQLDTGWGTGSGREGQALPRGEQGAGSGSDSAQDQRTDASAAEAREPGLLSLFA